MKARLSGSDRYDALVDEHEPVAEHGRNPPVRQGFEDVGFIMGRIRACLMTTMSCSAVSIWVVIVDSSIGLRSEAQDLVNEDDGDAAGHELAVDDEDLVNAAVHAIRRLGAGILKREDVLVDAAETLLEIGHDLLRPHDEDQSPRTGGAGAELSATGRGREQRSILGDGMH